MYLDTHVVVWLYSGNREKFPKDVINLLESEELLISPICELELQYLFETNKIGVDAKTITTDLTSRIGLRCCSLKFENIVFLALQESWTRDPFDRIITSQARLRTSILLTKDRLIHKHYSKARWG